MAFDGLIYCWHIDSSNVESTCCRLLFCGLVCTVMSSLYVDHKSNAVGHICAMLQAYISEASASDEKCMYICVPDHIVDCIGFI